jgi:predicted nucleotidyltransferase
MKPPGRAGAMIAPLPSSLPDAHRRFLISSVDVLARDARILGIAAGGSFLANAMDEFSDLDLLVATEPGDHGAVMADRRRIAESLGPLLAAFTGEHVGEPRLLICLYDGVPPLHVDLKFVALPDIAERVEDPAVLWERDGRLSRALEAGTAVYPLPNLQWIEDRFWVWIHYAAAKVGRGEIFEVLDGLSFLRTTVLGPLALVRSGARPAGVRKLEMLAPAHVDRLRTTVAAYDAADCVRALRACVDSYRALRSEGGTIEFRTAAEAAAMQYLSNVEDRGGLTRA